MAHNTHNTNKNSTWKVCWGFLKRVMINDKKCFKDELEIQKHISFIEDEIKKSNKDKRMLELRNWLNYLKAA